MKTMIQPLINPYTAGPPVAGTSFYGRKELLLKVQNALNSSNVILLQGQRRIGKTSFLKQLAEYLRVLQSGNRSALKQLTEYLRVLQSGNRSAPPLPPLPPVISDIQRYVQDVLPLLQLHSRSATSLYPVIFDIQRYVYDTLPQFQLHLAETIVKNLQLSAPKLVDLEASPALFGDKWLPQVYEQLGERRLVILVDEFDNLDEQTAPQAIRTLIPFLSQLVSSELKLKWVFVIGRWAGRLSIAHEPITRSGIRFQISFFSREETRQLIEQPVVGMLTYQPEAIDRIYQLTNGQPHLTQGLGYEIFQYVVLEEEREVATAQDVDQVISQTLETYGPAISSIVRVPPVEERILAAIASLTCESQSTSRKAIIDLLLENQIPLTSAEFNEALANLSDWELLKGDVQMVQVSVELVRLWIVRHLLVEPSREESLDIQAVLAESRFEFAEKARRAGNYNLAIDDYKEALKAVPKHLGALKGLVETYRLTGDLAGRVNLLQKLYAYEHNTRNELIDALENYAQAAEKQSRFLIAAEQYEALLKLQNRALWKKYFKKNLIRELNSALDAAEKVFSDTSTREISLLRLADLHSKLVTARQNIEDSTSVLDGEEANELCRLVEEIVRRRELVLLRFHLVEAYKRSEWREVIRLLRVLESKGVKCNSLEIKIMIKAAFRPTNCLIQTSIFVFSALGITWLGEAIYQTLSTKLLSIHMFLLSISVFALLFTTVVATLSGFAKSGFAKFFSYEVFRMLNPRHNNFYDSSRFWLAKKILKIQEVFDRKK